jgi:SNF2 family DNA or RNA helicase
MIEFSPTILVCDESHRVKSPSAMQSKEIAKLSRLCLYRLNMTGTPMTNSELDLFQQFYILDGGATFGNNFYSFRGKYFEDKNASRRGAHNYFPDWQVRKGSTEAIKAILSKRSFVVRKSECLDLPDMVYKEVEVELSSEQRRAYMEMKEDFLTTLKDAQGNAQTAVGRLAITKGLRLQQIVSGFVTPEDSEEISFKDNPRLDALSDLLEDLPSPVIVWASFRRNYKDIAGVCEKLKLSHGFLTGGQSPKDRDQTLEDFRAGKINVLIANQGAGGVGVNLIEAASSIYFSRDFSLEKDIQSEARNYRGGSEIHEKVTRYDLVSRGTIDMDVLKALRGKRDVLEYLLQGKI